MVDEKNSQVVKKEALLNMLEDLETEKKKAVESEEKYRAIVENAMDAIFVIDRDYRYVSVNKSTADNFGIASEKIIGKSVNDMFPKSVAARLTRYINRVFKTGKNEFIDEMIPLKNKNLYISTQLNPIFGANKKVSAVLGIGRDITERKKAEDKLIESNEKFEFIADSADSIIVAIDKNLRVSFANKKCCKALGYSKKELMGQKGLKFLDKSQIPFAIKGVALKFFGKSMPTFEARLKSKSGKMKKILFSTEAKLIYKDGKPSELIAQGKEVS